MKRVLSLFLSCIFVLGVCFSTPIVASAAEEVYLTFDGGMDYYEYIQLTAPNPETSEPGTCALVGYTGTGDVDIASSTIGADSGNYTLTEIASTAFPNGMSNTILEIPANITSIEDGAFANCTLLTTFEVAEGNKNYSSVDGVLFEKVETSEQTFSIRKLVAYPADKAGAKYIIPADVEEIATNAFSGVSETLVLEASEPAKITTNPDGLVIHEVITEGEHTVNGYVVNENDIKSVCSCGIELETIATIAYVGEFTDTNDGIWAKNANINTSSEYLVSLSEQGEYNSNLSVETISDGKLSFWVKKETESAQQVTVDLGIKLDSIAPTGTIALGETSWNEYLNNVTFDLFFKEVKTVTITPADENGSGVKSVEYYISTEVKSLSDLESLADKDWKELTLDAGSVDVNLKPNSKNIVYAKITDNVGNVKYISSNGIVLYSDSITETENINYTKFSNVSVEVKVNLNGNTIKEVKNGDTVLTSGYSISVSDDVATITFLSEMLDGLSIGESQITISYNPLGISSGEDTITLPFTINKATPIFTAPTRKTNLEYTGSTQELVNAGDTDLGVLEYSLDNANWNQTIPMGTEAGEYTVYYRVESTDDYNGVEGDFKVTIAPKTITATLTQDSGVYNGSAHEPTVKIDGLCENETLVKDTDYTVNYANNTNVGSATVTVTLEETSVAKNYTFANNAKTTTLNYTITAGVASIKTAPTVKTGLVYTGSAQELVKAGEATNGTMQYRLSENESWSTTIPSGINAKTYTVYYKVKGDLNYSDSDVASVDVAIAKATPTTENFKIDLPTNLIFNGEPKKVTVNCGADIGDITVEYYSGETKLESAPVEVGTYTVKINVAASDNYNAASGITSDDWKFAITECTKHEWKNSKCTICKIDCEHKYEDGDSAISNKVTTQATCVEEGVLLSQCKICDYEEETPLDIVADAHKMSDWTETVKATCSSTGTEERVCELGCGHKETRSTEKDPDNHTYGDWVVTAATCVADGVKVKTCKNTECKHELKETIAKDPTAHKMATEWEVTKEPTCVETGLQVKACLNAGCDHEVEEVIAIKADAHNLGGWVVTKAAKCTVAGEITRFCKNGNCEYKVTDSLDADGKTHSFAQDFTIIEATCITAGSKFKACENEGCKEVAEKTEIAINPDAHKNVETINVKQPTCEEKGYTGDEFCNDCKKTFEPGIEVDALGHTESDWIVDKEATFTEDGARHTVCKVCSKELKKEVIAKLTLATPVAKAYNKTSSIKVKWTDVDNALTYNVYRSDFINNDWTKWKKIGTVKQGVGEFSDKNVVAGKQYKYTVKAYNGEFKSSIKTSNKLTFIAPVKPALTITTTGIILKWDTVLGADKYVVYRSQLVDGKWSDWKKLSTVKDGKTSTTDTTAESGVTYKYSVRAYIGSSYTERKSSKTIVFLAQPTLKISNTEAGIKGSWKTINGATGYVITRSEYSDSDKKFIVTVKLGTASATAKSFTDKTAKEGIKYKYTITAISDSYSSLASSGKVLRRLAQPTVTIENANGAIKGKWTQVTGATKYTVYRSELVDGKWTSWKSLGTAGATAKSFTDKTVKSGVNYKYTVKAINGGSKSSVGASNNVVYLSRPEPKAVNSIYGVKVNWNAITGAESYIVYRKEYVNKQWTAWQQIGTSEVNSYIDSTAVSGVKYKYTIHAVKGESLSARKASSSLLYVATPSATVSYTGKALEISWGQIGGATKYVVYRQVLGADGKWSASTKIASLKGVLEFTDTSAEAGNTYRYKVVAYNGKVKSSSNVTDGVLLPKAQ